MKCSEISKRMSAYLDGELDSRLTQEISTHMDYCPSCRQELEELSGVDGLLTSMPRHELPSKFADEVVLTLRKMECPHEPQGTFQRAWMWLMEWFESFLDLLQVDKKLSTRTLEEFNDIPASFIGHAYFKILG